MLLSLLFPDYTMLLSLRAKLKIKSQRYRNKKNENLVLPKGWVENADLYKPVLNKILTTCELYVKYNFVAPLTKK